MRISLSPSLPVCTKIRQTKHHCSSACSCWHVAWNWSFPASNFSDWDLGRSVFLHPRNALGRLKRKATLGRNVDAYTRQKRIHKSCKNWCPEKAIAAMCIRCDSIFWICKLNHFTILQAKYVQNISDLKSIGLRLAVLHWRWPRHGCRLLTGSTRPNVLPAPVVPWDQKHTQTRFISRFQEVSSSKFHPKACWRKDGCKSCHWYSPREVLGSTWSVRNPMPRALGNPKDFHPTSRLHPKPPPRASSQHPIEKKKSWSHEVMKSWNGKQVESKKKVFECFWTCSKVKEYSKYFQPSKAIILQSIYIDAKRDAVWACLRQAAGSMLCALWSFSTNAVSLALLFRAPVVPFQSGVKGGLARTACQNTVLKEIWCCDTMVWFLLSSLFHFWQHSMSPARLATKRFDLKFQEERQLDSSLAGLSLARNLLPRVYGTFGTSGPCASRKACNSLTRLSSW